MGHKKLKLRKIILLYILGLYGFFYLVVPHNIHIRISPDWLLGLNFPHTIHITIGIVLLASAAFILYKQFWKVKR